MNAAPNFEDRWLDDLLSTPPDIIPDEGFTSRAMTRIRIRRLFRPTILGSLGVTGILLAAELTSLEFLGALLPADEIARALEAVPMPDAVDYTSPAALAIIAVALLIGLISETV